MKKQKNNVSENPQQNMLMLNLSRAVFRFR